MISPNFICAMGIVPIRLEKLIGVQLTCVGSKSTITFGNQHVEEYFNIANIDYYDVILGTLFLRKLNIVLDFTSPGTIHMGTNTAPRNIPLGTNNDNPKVVTPGPWPHKPPG